MTVSLSTRGTRAVILDIEGTTTPVAFVYDVMFPFARRHVADYLARRDQFEPCREAVALLRADYEFDAEQGLSPAGAVSSAGTAATGWAGGAAVCPAARTPQRSQAPHATNTTVEGLFMGAIIVWQQENHMVDHGVSMAVSERWCLGRSRSF